MAYEIDNLVALIMAGGRGERLWPRSTVSSPKHILSFGTRKTMVEETVARLRSLVPLKRIFVVTGRDSVGFIKKNIPEFPPKNFIVEPFPRNTAACIGLASVFIRKRFPEAVISVFPSDHVIKKKKRFVEAIKLAALWAEREKAFVTVGIRPDRPETGYGYIELGEKMGEKKGIPVHRVQRFVEKPDLRHAKRFVSSDRYLWNGGMFVFRLREIFEAFRTFMPEFWRRLVEIETRLKGKNRAEAVNKIYKNLKSISIDYAIMEKASNRLVVVSDFFWNDVGSWISLEDLYRKDRFGNISLGDVISLNTEGSILVSDKGLIAAIGLKDITIVSTGNATLVFPKQRAQDVKKVVEAIREKSPFKKYI